MHYYFRLQLLRASRRLADFGLPLPVAVGLGLAGWVLGAVYLYGRFTAAPYILVALTIVTLWPLSAGARFDRLERLFSRRDVRLIRYTEQLTGGSVSLLVLLGYGSWLAAGVLLALLSLLAEFRRGGSGIFVLPTPFRRYPYESAVGLRRYGWVLPLLYFVAWQGVSADNVNLLRFTGVGCGLLVMSFYADTPPPELLRMYRSGARGYLRDKIRTAGYAYTLFALPIWVALGVVWPDGWVLHLLVIGLGLLYITGMIVVQYAGYPRQPDFLRSVAHVAGMCFPPLLLILLIGWYREARRRLNAILT
ncbi:hypothetical protein CLV84_0313 [Neolewinella xylanilytica]|uniref:Uncharacterized protein n=1 Tax=Neolewinella xylanilytica TaxID=1514080 RepID=A0A2S6I795_9BACT|nr:hypothetical protein [Neolewinella xylanilytica]PPK87373.1 hypothetical protein CLV84_0313 [Neolewinella xylanilytica]